MVICGILGGDLQLTTAIRGTVGLFCACAEICLYIAVGDDSCHGLCRSAVFRQTVSLCRGHCVLVVDAGCTGLDRARCRWQWDRFPSCRTSCRSCWRRHTTSLCQQQTLPVQGGTISAVHFACHVTHFYSAPQCSHCKRCISYSNSVCPSVRLSVTRRYYVKTTALSTVQFALLDSKMCLVL